MEISEVLGIAIIISAILVSMTLHEAMHAFTSFWLGDDTAARQGRLTLNPIAHIDPVLTLLVPVVAFLLTGIPFGAAKPVPFNPYRVRGEEYGAALVGIAGPLTNLVLAFVGGYWARFVFNFEGLPADIAILFMFVNLSFFAINMVPWPPLDGSRLIYAFAPESVQNFMRQIEAMGFMSIAIFFIVIYGLVGPIISDVIFGIGEFILGRRLVV